MKQVLQYILIGVTIVSCDNFLEVGPNNSELDTELVFKNDNTALAALDAVYHELQINGFASVNTSIITLLGNTLCDHAKKYNTINERYYFYLNNLKAHNGSSYYIWSSAYKQLYNTNALLEKIKDNVDLSGTTKKRIVGEAKFLRAFIYYYLVHLYDELPLVLTTYYHRSEEHTSELQSRGHLVCRLLLE